MKRFRQRLAAAWRALINKPSPCIGPKDFRPSGGWSGRGVMAQFDGLHGLEILVSDACDHTEETFGKTWGSDADEVIFRRDKLIMLYWRERA